MKSPINILIVDDEPKNLTVLETVLNDPSYRLIRAESAEQALLALVVEDFALLILDIRMPSMTGFELAKMIRDRKKTARVPIIFLTAYFNEDQHVLTGYDTGAVDYLHKPVNPVILRSKVMVFADLHRKSLENEAANRALLAEVAVRRRAEEELRELNATLEQCVADRTEALQEADRRKDEFLAILAHELRNPLAPMRIAARLLQAKNPVTSEWQWAGEVIDRQTRHLARLVDDLMDVSRISRGKIELKRERIELTHVLQEAIETSRPLIDECGHEMTVTMPPGHLLLEGDATRLQQVFLNLLNNSAKYTERGGQIALRAQHDGSDVLVSVKDTGIGIPIDKLPTIFEMFSQVEGALSRAQGGLGIGLCLARRLVELHGGRIEVHSDGPGKGSEFVVRLPVVTGEAYRRPPVEQECPNPTSALRILVVDDNQDASASLAMLLKMMGNTVQTAADGEEAVRAAGEFRPHVVLCDIGLPKLNGYEACRRMKQLSWDKKMTLVAVTGWGQSEDRQRAEEAGFDYHMVKPVDPHVLMQLLAKLDVVMV